MLKHYIENKDLIPDLLDHGWIIRNESWTDCPPSIQKKIEDDQLKSYFMGNNPKLHAKNQEALKK